MTDEAEQTRPKRASTGPRFKDMTGLRFGRLFVLSRAPNIGALAAWLCHCDCGVEKVIRGASLRSGLSHSCGCAVGERTIERNRARTTHGASRLGAVRSEYKSWAAIISRCEDPRAQFYSHYGQRGIRICAGWRHDFASFLADVGDRPVGRSIDRKDNDGHYSCGHCAECIANGWPANCRWATRREQMQNTRANRMLTLGGETHCIAEWARRTGLRWDTIDYRLRRGWSVERALSGARRDAR